MPPTVIDLDDSSEEDEVFLNEIDAIEPRARFNIPAKRSLTARPSDTIDLTGEGSSQETVSGPFRPPARKQSKLQVFGSGLSPRAPAPSNLKGKEREPTPAPKLDLEEDLTCGICMDLLLGPVLTSCGHTACSDCLKACFVKNRDQCPVCRQTTTAAYRNLALEGVIDKYFEYTMRELEAAGKHGEAKIARKERDGKVKALETARIAQARRDAIAKGCPRRVRIGNVAGHGGYHGGMVGHNIFQALGGGGAPHPYHFAAGGHQFDPDY